MAPASASRQRRRRERPWRPPLLGLAIAASAASAGLVAHAAPWLPFPSQENLREVQLAALACARENTAASCERARALADPLLDHPRLPAACKDQLWAISSKAQPAASNSFSRREALAQPAQLMMLSCRSAETKAPPAASPPATGGSGQRGGAGS